MLPIDKFLLFTETAEQRLIAKLLNADYRKEVRPAAAANVSVVVEESLAIYQILNVVSNQF